MMAPRQGGRADDESRPFDAERGPGQAQDRPHDALPRPRTLQPRAANPAFPVGPILRSSQRRSRTKLSSCDSDRRQGQAADPKRTHEQERNGRVHQHDADPDGDGRPGVLEGEEGRGNDLDPGDEGQAEGEKEKAG